MPSADLTETEKAQIRLYLGWSARFHQFFPRLEQALAAMASPDSEHDDRLTVIRNALTKIATIETLLDGIQTTTYQAASVGKTVLQAPVQRQMLIMDARRHRDRIASTLGVEVINDVWSGGGVQTYMTPGGPGVGGNDIPMG